MYMMIGYRFLRDHNSLLEVTDTHGFSASHAVVRNKIGERDMETGRNRTMPEPMMGYLMFLFLFISALGSLIFMIRLIKGRT
jgi:hypothetical protein